MKSLARTAWWGVAGLLLAGVADAQDTAPLPVPDVTAPSLTARRYLSQDDTSTLRAAIDAGQAGDVDRARSLQASLSDPVSRKLVLWAMADSAANRLSFFELDQARRDLWGWPRASRRQAGAERLLEAQGMSPTAVIAWFKGEEPTTAEGAMALAGAYRLTGQVDKARDLIRRFWREKVFEAEPQRQMLARFGDLLTVDDHIRRTDMLLYGAQGPATRDMIALLPPDWQALAQVRIAFRNGGGPVDLLMDRLPATLADDPSIAFERARHLVRQHNTEQALPLIGRLPTQPPGDEAGAAVWYVRKSLIGAALANHDYRAAYQAAANHGLQPGVDYAEAEFFAGWIALSKLKDPVLADQHFARIEQVGASPITQARALYWRGRANEASGDIIGAKDLYAQAAQLQTTFYGQLAGERAGVREITLGHDPIPTAADRARFEGRDMVQAARILAGLGEKDLFRTFVLTIDDDLPNAEEYALLVDLARSLGDPDLGMRVVRAGAQHGIILPDRGYPILAAPPRDPSFPELAFVYGIVRQESNFDPRQRSGAGARGMMQLMPATAQHVARRMGLGYYSGALEDPDYNVRVGSGYLGQMVSSFGGSYVMAAAAYNAGPGRLPDWAANCGDPRGSSNDPVDFIECIPISETRNYVMRVLEAMQVYRARLNGGRAPLTLAEDLRRGVYVPGTPTVMALGEAPADRDTTVTSGPGAMAPIPD